MTSIPLALSIGIVLLQIFGFNLNQLNIVGLVVALGLLVDDIIVVVENIECWMREGYSRMDATLKATSQVGKAVLASTVTACGVNTSKIRTVANAISMGTTTGLMLNREHIDDLFNDKCHSICVISET